MVHSEVYLNKYVVSIAPFSTPAFTPNPIQKTALFCMLSLINFSSIFQGGSADSICPYVRTPMAPCVVGVILYRCLGSVCRRTERREAGDRSASDPSAEPPTHSPRCRPHTTTRRETICSPRRWQFDSRRIYVRPRTGPLSAHG